MIKGNLSVNSKDDEIKPAIESLITDTIANSEPLDVDNMFDDSEENK